MRGLLAIILCLTASAVAGSLGAWAAPSTYSIEGMALGGQFRPARDYQCKDSIQFTNVTWCLRKRHEWSRRGGFLSSTSVLLTPDGAIGYVNREIEPAFLAPQEVQTEIDRLTAKFGARGRIMRLPPRAGLPNAVIAAWGGIELEQLDDDVAASLATSSSPRLGLLVDYLGDVRQSAELRLPIFRLSGGAGYLWSTSADDAGSGHLRFLEADVSALAPGKIAKPAPAAAPAPAAVAEPEKPTAGLGKAAAEPPAKEASKPARSNERASANAERPAAEESARTRIARARPEAEKPTGSLGKTATERPAVLPPKETVKPKTAARFSADAERFAVEDSAPPHTVPPRLPGQPASEDRGTTWAASQSLMIILAGLALVAFALAMRIQRQEAEQTELAADRKASLQARLGRTPSHEPEPRRGGPRADAAAHPGIFGMLKSYVSAAALLTLAVTIYLQSQNPAAIKNFIAHVRQATATSMLVP